MDYQLSDPVILLIIGILVSLVWEQTDRFQEDKVSGLAKIALVLVTGIALSIGFTLLKVGIPTVRSDWYALVVNSLVVAFSTQAFHLSLQKYVPGMSDLLVQLRTGQPIVNVTNVSSETPKSPADLGLSAGSLVPDLKG